MNLSTGKTILSENKIRGSNYSVYPMSSVASSASIDHRTGRPIYFMPNNQPSGVINDKPPSCPVEVVANTNDVVPTQSETKKKSIVITNSSISSVSQSQSLCRVEFQNNGICLALPPGITWEEINAPSLSEEEIYYLLDFTTQLNFQLKRKKKRSRSYRNDSTSVHHQYQKYVDTRPYVPSSTRNQSANKNYYFESKPSTSSPNKNSTGSKTNSSRTNMKSTPSKDKKVTENHCNKAVGSESDILEAGIPKSSWDTSHESVAKSISNVKGAENTNNKCKIGRNEMLELREIEVTNQKIIQSLRKYKILSSSSPFAQSSLKQTSHSSRANNPSCSFKDHDNHDPKLLDSKVKELMRHSWVGSDDGVEGETSKEIYQNLVSQADNFEKNASVSPSPKNVKKKNKKVEKKTNSIEKTKVLDEPHEIFDDYYDDLKIEEGLKNGTMYQDILRINLKNWREAFVSCSLDDNDIFIDGIKNRNRALDGDEVVVELLSDKETPDKGTVVFEDNIHKSVTRKCGKVVRLIKENHPRTAVGSLKAVYSKKKLTIFHSPIDPRLPRIRIAINTCTPKLRLRHLDKKVVYLAKITAWETTANAEGILLEEIGNEEAPGVETKCILFENSLDVTPVSNFMLAPSCKIPNDEMSPRVDIREKCVFTIDPPGAKDLDDALSCGILPNGNIEVGVHIADVTHFLKPDSPLDLDARKKATSVYLTETVYHMLPIGLCQLCSLTPGEDKLAFSVFIEFDEEANVISHQFNKTMIRSCVQLTYAHAQDVIENYSETYEPVSFPPVVNGFTATECVQKILLLQKLASKMRERRFSGGALKIDQPKIVFNLDEDNMPRSFSLYVGRECNWLIEEFMLLANILAANKTIESFPETALLRFHSSPKEKSLTSAVEYLEKVGIFIDTTDAGTIYRSMMQYEGFDEIGMARMAVITNFLVKPMVKALYVCASKNTDRLTGFWHYALNTPYYTHFTSPIRRYADVVVHRFLAASLGYSKAPQWTPDEIQEIAINCNTKKSSSKKASETSTELYLKIYLERCGPMKVRAVVVDVKERHFELMDLTTRTISRIMVNKIQGAEKVEFENESMPSLKVTWKNEPESLEQIIQIFTIVDVELSYQKSSGLRLLNKIHVELLKPIT